jgi:hypothetical protein
MYVSTLSEGLAGFNKNVGGNFGGEKPAKDAKGREGEEDAECLMLDSTEGE